MGKLIFQNYHRHSTYTNPRISDSIATNRDYAKRAVDLGHGIISSCEHGWQGRYIEAYELAKEYNLKFIFGAEAYWVKDRFEKDRSNCHIFIAARNENGRQAINDILSEANITGFYGQPRLDISLIMSLPPNDVIVTTACVAYWKYEDVDIITKRFADYFGKNFFLEVQYHNTDAQRNLNSHILDLKQKYDLQIIMGCDSHYISEGGSNERDNYLVSKGMIYDDESGWYLDYPDGDTAYKRFANQCTLSHEQILEAIGNTNVFLEVEEYNNPCFTKDIKMPTLYGECNQDEKDKIYKDLVWSQWEIAKKEISPNEWAKYEEEIKRETDIVITTKHADYFLDDYHIVKRGIEKGGVITPSGRGSGVSFYTNKLLGFTDVDRIAAKVKMYPERFMSPTRILETKSLADLDLNLGTVSIFAEAQREILGDDHAYPMLAYGTLKPKAAWKMYAKSQSVDFDLANEVSGQIEKYEAAIKHANEDDKDDINILDYIDKQFHDVYKESEKYLGVISDWKIHPCLTENALILTTDGYKKINEVNIGDQVLSHTGKFNKVLNTMSRLSNEYYEFTVGGITTEVTGNHPVYVITNTVSNNGSILGRSEPYWKPISELTRNDLIGFSNIHEPSEIPIYQNVQTDNKEFWWIVGRYLGDGYLTESNRIYSPIRRINISCHIKEIDEITKKLDAIQIKYHIANTKGNSCEVAFYGQYIWKFLKQFGQYAHGKFLPHFVYLLPDNLLKSLVDGYMSADGYFSEKQCTYVTVSEQLAYGMQLCVQKAYKVNCLLTFRKPAEGCINGKHFIRRKAFRGTYSYNPIKKQRNVYIGDHAWSHFKAKKIDQQVKVYNLEVENDQSYTANNIMFHNCSYLLYQGSIRKEIGLVKIKENLCCIMDGKWAEDYKFLKNDLLKVSVVELIDKVYKRIGIKRHSVNELLAICTPDNKVWDVYKTGCTLGINQVEQPATKSRVMKYQPHNISELCAFVAAIRPGFKSMYKKFENRERFEYGIRAFDELIQTPEMPNTFILYQEMAMAALNYADIPMSECYDVIKNIAKKRSEKVLKYKEQFLVSFKNAIINTEGKEEKEAEKLSHNIWQILEDSVRYMFNASHSYCVAIDSLFGAYLKTYYPLQFYEVFLSICENNGEKDRLNEAKEEAEEYFKINFPPYRFRQDNRNISSDATNNAISKSLSSIKGFGNNVAEILFNIKDNSFTFFIDILFELSSSSIQLPQIDKLIKIDYFNEFGNAKELTEIKRWFDILKQGAAKQLSREHVVAEIESIVGSHVSGQKKDGSPSKSFSVVDMYGLLTSLEKYIKSKNIEDHSYQEKMQVQLEILGYVDLTTNVPDDRRKLLITNTRELKSQDGITWGWAIFTRSIGTGKTARLTLRHKNYVKTPIYKADIIFASDVTKNKSGYWYLNEYRKIS